MNDSNTPVGHNALHQRREKNTVPAIIPMSNHGTVPCNMPAISWLNSAKGVKKSTQLPPNKKITVRNNSQKYRAGCAPSNTFILSALNALFFNTALLTLSTSVNKAPKGQSQPQNTLPSSSVEASVSSGNHTHAGMLCCHRKWLNSIHGSRRENHCNSAACHSSG